MYAKLFGSIYSGSLATRGPWQALITFQQLLILADRFGIVDCTREYIAKQTTLPIEIIALGIEALEKPDPESRRPDAEGRRIIRLSEHRDWGWQITNYEHYRSIRSAEERRDYQREYMRERRNAVKNNQPVYTEEFARFWNAYPRKAGKGAAWRSWRKLNPSEDLQIVIFNALAQQIVSSQWTRDAGKFIPHPATWLNQSRWEDEPATVAKRDIVV